MSAVVVTEHCYSYQAAGLSPKELTQLNLDKTQLLEKLIADGYGGNADIMLGELQVSLLP